MKTIDEREMQKPKKKNKKEKQTRSKVFIQTVLSFALPRKIIFII